MFRENNYVRVVDTQGNFRYGFISKVKSRGDLVEIDMTEEGLCKINYDAEFSQQMGVVAKDFRAILTEAEKRIIPMLGDLMTTKEIASMLKISPVTVRAHIRELKIKLSLETREQLIAYAQGIARTLALNGTKVPA